MRFSGRRLFGGFALSLALSLGLAGCSGQQQEEDGLEVSEQGNQAAANEEAAEDQAVENEQAAEDNQAAENQEAANEEASQQGGDETADAGNGTENDLQEIISEMNGQQTAEGAPAEAAEALPQQDATALQTAAPVDQAAAAPAPAPAAPAEATAAAPSASSSPIPFQPGGSPAGTGLPEIGSKMAYIVQKGDTLGKISQKIYGNLNRWNELATLSGLTNPSRIFPGDVVYYTLDETAVAFATAYESIQRAEETVQQGDTLATIAKRIYGSTTAWRTIWRQNDKIDNPDVLASGTTVYYIPTGAMTAAAKAKTNNNLTAHKATQLSLKAAKNAAKAEIVVDSVKATQKAKGQIGHKIDSVRNNLNNVIMSFVSFSNFAAAAA